jgi:hypothetical protein
MGVAKWSFMKMRNSIGKKSAGRVTARRAPGAEAISLPRMFLFLELFVDKDIPGRSTK